MNILIFTGISLLANEMSLLNFRLVADSEDNWPTMYAPIVVIRNVPGTKGKATYRAMELKRFNVPVVCLCGHIGEPEFLDKTAFCSECHTRSEWYAIQNPSKAELDRFLERQRSLKLL